MTARAWVAAGASCALFACGGAPFSDALGSVEAGSPETSDAGMEAGTGVDAGTFEASTIAHDSGMSADAAIEREVGSYEGSTILTESGTCVADLSNIGLADFRIAFDVRTTDKNATPDALLNQMAVCGTYHPHWQATLVTGGLGTVGYELSDGTSNVTLEGVTPVTDGLLHHVLIARTSGTLSITIDGHLDNSAPGAVDLVALGMLQIGVSVCGNPLVGQVTNVCLVCPSP